MMNVELRPLKMAELQGAGIDWSLLGFDQDELAKLLDPGVKQGLTDPDEIPEPPAGTRRLREILESDPPAKYTLTDNLWGYLAP